MSALPLLTSHKLQINLKKVYILYTQLISHKNIHGGLEDSHIFDISHISSSCKSSLFGNMHIFLWHLQDLGTYSSYEKPRSQHGQFCRIWLVHRLHYMLLVTTRYMITFVQTSANMCELDKTTIFNNTTVEREQDTPVLQYRAAKFTSNTLQHTHVPCHELPALASVSLHIIYLLEQCKRTANVRCVSELKSSGWRSSNSGIW